MLKTEAVRDVGVLELRGAIRDHQAWLTKSGHREEKGRRFLKEEVLDILAERLERTLSGAFETASGKDLLEQMLKRELDPYTVADLISGV